MCQIIHPAVCLYYYFIFHADGLENKDTGFKYNPPTEQMILTRCATDNVSLIFESKQRDCYVFIEEEESNQL